MVLALITVGTTAQASTQLDLGVDTNIESRRGGGFGFGFGWGPGFGPGRGHGRHQAYFVCRAQNARGHMFRAEGFRPNVVQNRAVDNCYAYSRHCRPLGCHRVR